MGFLTGAADGQGPGSCRCAPSGFPCRHFASGSGVNSLEISRLWADFQLRHARPLMPPPQSTCRGLLKRRPTPAHRLRLDNRFVGRSSVERKQPGTATTPNVPARAAGARGGDGARPISAAANAAEKGQAPKPSQRRDEPKPAQRDGWRGRVAATFGAGRADSKEARMCGREERSRSPARRAPDRSRGARPGPATRHASEEPSSATNYPARVKETKQRHKPPDTRQKNKTPDS